MLPTLTHFLVLQKTLPATQCQRTVELLLFMDFREKLQNAPFMLRKLAMVWKKIKVLVKLRNPKKKNQSRILHLPKRKKENNRGMLKSNVMQLYCVPKNFHRFKPEPEVKIPSVENFLKAIALRFFNIYVRFSKQHGLWGDDTITV